MKTTLTAFAALLLAGASTAALAQDRDRSGGDRPLVQGHSQSAAPAAPSGGHAPSPAVSEGRSVSRLWAMEPSRTCTSMPQAALALASSTVPDSWSERMPAAM